MLHHISPTIFPNQQDITSSLMSKLSNESNKGQIRPAGVARFALEVCGRLMFLILYYVFCCRMAVVVVHLEQNGAAGTQTVRFG